MALSTVAAFLELTREAPLRDANYILNDTAIRTYTLQRLLAGKPADSVVNTGSSIVEELKLSASSNAAEFAPGDPASVSGSGSTVKAKFHWRFLRAQRPLNKYQLTLNSGSDQKTVMKNLGKKIRNDLKQDTNDVMESRLWGPTEAAMETSAEQTNAKPISIPTYITEQVAPVGLASQNTLAAINFTTFANWDNQRFGYDATNPFGSAGLLSAFDNMQLLVGFVPPTGPAAPAFSPDKRAGTMIFTNKNGINLFKAACRAGNDRFFKAGNDPAYPSVDWNGTELMYAAQLDAALLEQSSGTAYSTAVYGATKPRFFFVNPDFLWPNFHPEHYMNEEVMPASTQYPDTEVVFQESMWQNICISRRRQGLVCPSASWVTNS